MTLNMENMGSRGGGIRSLRRRYTVDASGQASPEEYVVTQLESLAPTSLAGLVPTDFVIDENPEIEDLYDCEVQYGVTDLPAAPPSTGAIEYRFNFQAQGGHFYQSLETIASYLAGGGTAPNFKGAINVVNDAGKRRCEGLQVDPPPETFTLAYYPENATITTAYQELLNGMCGTVNEYDFDVYPAGSLMLVRCSGGVRTLEDWSIDFGFSYVPNQTDIPVGDAITVTSKDGHDLLWAFYGDKEDANVLVKQPVAAYVERVWRRSDFSLLSLPSWG